MFALIQSCTVDNDYSMEELMNIDTHMSLFQNGISIPLGSTDKIRLDSLLERSGIMDEEFGEYIKKAEDGSYYVSYSGSYDLSDKLSSLNINELGSLIPTIDETWSNMAGIVGKDYSIDLDIKSLSEDAKLFKKSEMDAVAKYMGDGDFNVPESVAMVYDFIPVDEIIKPFDLPEGISAIKSVELGENAAVKVSLSLINPMMSKGSITPLLNFDADGLVKFKNGETVDLSNLVLSEKNSYKSTEYFPISEVNIDALTKSHTLVADGRVVIADAVTNKKLINAATGDMAMRIEIDIVGLEFKNVAFEIEPMNYEINESVGIGFKDTDIPEQVKTLKSVKFSDNSIITLNINALNFNTFKDIDAKLEKLTVSFPPELSIEGEGISGNTLTIASADLKTPLSRTVKVKELQFQSPNGCTSYSGKVNITGKASLSGIVNSSEIPSELDKDPGIIVSVSGTPSIAEVVCLSDYTVTIVESVPMPDLAQFGEDATVELPEIETTLDINSNMSIPVKGYMEFLGDKYTVDFPVSKAGELASSHNNFKFNVNKLFEMEPKPEDISLSMTAGIDPSRDCIIRTGDSYSLSADYAMNLPIQLGRNTSVSLRDTVIIDSKDAAKVINNNVIDLLGRVESTLPIGLDIAMTLLDSADNGSTLSVIPLKKPAKINIDAAGTSDFELSLELNSIEAVQNLYAIVLDINVNSNGQPLKGSDYIKVSLSASLPHGISFDPEEALLGEDNNE